MNSKTIRLGNMVMNTTAEGPGERVAIWVQGCSIRCKFCCNPGFFNKGGGEEYNIQMLVEKILASPAEGITILGGEPMDQPEAVLVLAAAIFKKKSVAIFSGYTLEEMNPAQRAVLEYCDLLIDGRYDHTQPEKDSPNPRRWLGSRNQKIHFLTDRYSIKDFEGSNTIEIRYVNGKIQVNGWPGVQLRVLDKRN